MALLLRSCFILSEITSNDWAVVLITSWGLKKMFIDHPISFFSGQEVSSITGTRSTPLLNIWLRSLSGTDITKILETLCFADMIQL